MGSTSLHPHLTLGRANGSTELDPGDLVENSNFRFGYGPLSSWTFPNIFAARARIEQASAGSDAALANFDQVVLEALQETETALRASRGASEPAGDRGDQALTHKFQP